MDIKKQSFQINKTKQQAPEKPVVADNIASIVPYPPGKPLEELEREYGISNSIKLASNENSFGPSPKALDAIQSALSNLFRYPDGSGYYLVQALSRSTGLDSSEIVLGNGSNEVIEFLVKAYVAPGDEVITSHPSFLMYEKFVQIRGGVNCVIPLKDMHHDLQAIKDAVTEKTRLIFLDNPNNPTATAIPPGDLYVFLSEIPQNVIVVLDEAYVDFMDNHLQVDIYSLIRNADNRCPVVSLRTFSKAYGLAGLRVGYGLMPAEIASMLQRVRQPFNVNLLGLEGALAALEDEEYYQQTLSRTREEIEYLQREVEQLGCTSYPSQTNFFLIDVHGDATVLYEAMLRKGVIIRSMKAYQFPHFIRVTAGTREENDRFLAALAQVLQELSYV